MARRSANHDVPIIQPVGNNHVDRDIDAMLRKSQPGHFDGEGIDVGKKLEEWLKKMDDYFDLAQSLAENRETMGRFKLEKSTKLWWRNHCLENLVNPTQVTWDYLKSQLQTNYQNRTF